jgi:hypothetical protein
MKNDNNSYIRFGTPYIWIRVPRIVAFWFSKKEWLVDTQIGSTRERRKERIRRSKA